MDYIFWGGEQLRFVSSAVILLCFIFYKMKSSWETCASRKSRQFYLYPIQNNTVTMFNAVLTHPTSWPSKPGLINKYFCYLWYVTQCCRRCGLWMVMTFVHMWILSVESAGVEHTFSIHHAHHTHISCVKGVIVKTEVMSGNQSICNTTMHKDFLSSHHEQSTTNTDGGL